MMVPPTENVYISSLKVNDVSKSSDAYAYATAEGLSSALKFVIFFCYCRLTF